MKEIDWLVVSWHRHPPLSRWAHEKPKKKSPFHDTLRLPLPPPISFHLSMLRLVSSSPQNLNGVGADKVCWFILSIARNEENGVFATSNPPAGGGCLRFCRSRWVQEQCGILVCNDPRLRVLHATFVAAAVVEVVDVASNNGGTVLNTFATNLNGFRYVGQSVLFEQAIFSSDWVRRSEDEVLSIFVRLNAVCHSSVDWHKQHGVMHRFAESNCLGFLHYNSAVGANGTE